MSDRFGAVLFAKDAERLAAFYRLVLGAHVRHAESNHIALDAEGIQLIIHAIPEVIASTIEVASPPVLRDEAAIKLFFTVPNLAEACRMIVDAGGVVHGTKWEGTGFAACDASDPEGNVFQLRESSS